MKIVILGTCANQTANREGVSFILSHKGQNILVDTGPGVVRQIYRSGYFCTDIQNIIVTHSHGDHTLGYPYVIFGHFYDRLEGKKGPTKINIYGTEEICKGLDAMLHFCYIPEKYPFSIEYIYLPDDIIYKFNIGSFHVTSAPVNHTTPTLGLRFEIEGKTLAYSSDTLACGNVVELAKNANLLIHEGFVTCEKEELALKVKHATARMAGETAVQANAKSLALVHLFPPFVGRELDLIDEAKNFFKGKIWVPEELSEIEL